MARAIRFRRPRVSQSSVSQSGSRPSITTPSGPLIERVNGLWRVTHGWMARVAEPRFKKFLEEATEGTGDLWRALRLGVLDPIDITYYVLEGQVPRVPFRGHGEARMTFLDLQAHDSKNPANYFSDAGTLELYRRLHDKIQDAIKRLERGGTTRGIALFSR